MEINEYIKCLIESSLMVMNHAEREKPNDNLHTKPLVTFSVEEVLQHKQFILSEINSRNKFKLTYDLNSDDEGYLIFTYKALTDA